MIKTTINLLQPELIPEKPLITLPRVVMLWGGILFVFVLAILITSYSLSSATVDNKKLTSANKDLTKSVSALEVKIKNQKPDEKLVQKLENLKTLLKHKQFFHQQLTDENKIYVSGFSQAMNELSLLHHKDISLSSVNIVDDEITFYGLARTPNSVPYWLSQFEKSTLLSGRSFTHFDLNEGPDNLTGFSVSSVANKKSLPDVKSLNLNKDAK